MMILWIIIGIYPFIFSANCSNLFHDAAQFCLKNGLNYLTISTKHFEHNKDVFKMTKEAQALSLITRELTFEDVPKHLIFFVKVFYSPLLQIALTIPRANKTPECHQKQVYYY